MTWNEIRASHPDRWLLVEALRAHSEGERRLVDDLAVLASFPDSAAALHEYAARHHAMPERELYVVHTSRESLDITERTWLGVRAAG